MICSNFAECTLKPLIKENVLGIEAYNKLNFESPKILMKKNVEVQKQFISSFNRSLIPSSEEYH